jgi:hypothetical protein
MKLIVPKVIDIDFCSGLEAKAKEIYSYILDGKLVYISYKKKSKEGGLFLGFFIRKFLSNLFENISKAEEFVFDRTDVDYEFFKKGYNYVDCCTRKFPVLNKK